MANVGGGDVGVRVVDGPVEWGSCHVRTCIAGPGTEPDGEPEPGERVYLNVPVYNQSRYSCRLQAGVPLLALRGSSKKEYKELESGADDAAQQVVDDLATQLEGQAREKYRSG